MAKRFEDALGDLPRLKRLIQASEFDLVVAASPENVLYTSDVFISTQVDIRDRLALVVWDGDRDPVFILCRVEEGFAREESWIDDIRTYKEFVTSPIDILAEVIDELGAARGSVGLELDYLPAIYFERLRALLPNARFGRSEPIFDRARVIKTPRERERLAAGFRGTERALKEAFLATRPATRSGTCASASPTAFCGTGLSPWRSRILTAGPTPAFRTRTRRTTGCSAATS